MIVSRARHLQTVILHYLKGFLPVFVSALKRSKFLMIICSLQKGISYSMQNPNKKRKIEDYWHAVVKYLPATCKRGADYL
jgi:hypothetical protein